ncbi:MAG: hypothetical protein LBF85_08675 [Tannerella sp.]|nr:hypothetical protein [Tannerella sp.]
MSLLQAMASGVIARHEAIQWADNKQITKHVIDSTRLVQKLKAERRSNPGQSAGLDCHVATLLAMTEIPFLSAMASAVIAYAKHEAIRNNIAKLHRAQYNYGYPTGICPTWRMSVRSE